MRLSSAAAIGMSAAAVVAALSSACSTQHDRSPNDDSQLQARVIGEPVDVATINSRATYLITFPHVEGGAYAVNLEIDCVECTKWMPGQLVLVMKDGKRVHAADAGINLVDFLAPLEVRHGDVKFTVKDPKEIDRIVLMRGDPLVPAAKWTVDHETSIPTMAPDAPAKIVALGDACTKSDDTAQTADGQTAYCARLDYTTTYLWAARQGVIPNEPVEVAQTARQAAPKPKPSAAPPPPPPPPPLIVLPKIELPPWLK